MTEAKDWDYLPHDITYLIFKDLSFLDDFNSKQGYQDVVNMLLVCSKFLPSGKYPLRFSRSCCAEITIFDWIDGFVDFPLA